jgi:hypothetical protein
MYPGLRYGSVFVVVTALAVAATASADYDSHPELRPSVRCAGLEDPKSRSGYNPDCQPLIWSLPAATRVGQKAVAAADPAWGFPNGMIDRPPPLYTNGVDGFERPGSGRTALCGLDQVPYWKPTGRPDEYVVACRRGTRAYFGPYAIGSGRETFDAIALKFVRFENSGRLARDGLAIDARREWNVATEMYTHYASHHATCDISIGRCNDPNDPATAASPSCAQYRKLAEQCPAEGSELRCRVEHDFNAFRATAGRQGRSTMDLPPGRAIGVVEDPLWLCNQHVINDEPPGFGSSRRRDFRRQVGGAVGEMVIQFFTAPYAAKYRPVSFAFDFVASNATSYFPPYTIGPQDTVWYAPFDLVIGMATMHSHENMVRGTIDVLPANSPRLASTDRDCGGAAGSSAPLHAYENRNYFEPKVCEYWRDADGPLVLRKGQAIRASCIVNNGVNQTQQIDEPAVRDAVETGPIGDFLYAGRDPSEYRVRYGCEKTTGVPPGTPGADTPFTSKVPKDCPPNPAVDEAGHPVDGPYDSPEYCPASAGWTGRCVPASVVFANTGEDTMCIPILMYWPLDRIVGADGSVNQDVVDRAASGDVDGVGAPGRVWQPVSDSGTCNDDAGDAGVNVDDPSPPPFQDHSRRCRAGL